MECYYVVRSGPRHWLLMHTRFGCNSYIIDDYSSQARAKSAARLRNKLLLTRELTS